MFFGWTGVDLEVDLSTGNVERSEVDRQLYADYLGGRGIASKLMWDRVPPEVHPFSPDNLLIFNIGLLVGTICPGANRTILTTRSPQNSLQTYSSMGGFFGVELKLSGYDSLIINRKADRPVYLIIQDDRVELRDAAHLWGKDTFETQRIIKQELGDAELQVVCIGPAGENRTYCASIEHANGTSASRAGVGAVMGDKKLKAIAVRGSKDVRIARPNEYGELCERLLERARKQKEWVDDISRNQIDKMARIKLKGNMEPETMDLDWDSAGDAHAKFLEEHRARRPSCFNCQIGCRQAVRLPGTGYGYLKCVSHCAYTSAFKIADFAFNFRAYELTERLGMDSISAAALGAFAIDLYEKGIIDKGDTAGLHLEYGNEVLALTLIEQIARRQGIGDVLANGVVEAARAIGRGAEEHIVQIKKLEQSSSPFQVPYTAFASALADRPDLTRLITYVPQHLFKKSKQFRESYVNSEFWPYPKDFIKYVWADHDPTGGDFERMAAMMSFDRDEIHLSDCTGVCTFWTDFWAYSPIKGREQAELISYATGMDVNEEEVLHIAARSGALLRAYNVILGLRRQDDCVPDKFYRQPVTGQYPALDRQKFDRLVDEYYRLRGWDANGIPTPESLAVLQLDYVANELERRGIYAGCSA